MRIGFGIIGLLVALAIVGVLAKKQMAATRMAVPPAPAASTPAATVRAQSQQVQEQVRQQVETLMQQPRPELDQ